MPSKKIILTSIAVLTLSLATACSVFSNDSNPADTETRTSAVEKTTNDPEDSTVILLTGEDNSRRITNEDFKQLRQDITGAKSSEETPQTERGSTDIMDAGYLPNGIKPRTTKSDSEVYVVYPGEFTEIAKLYRENTLQLHARFGEDRIIVSNWIKGIAGVSRPQIIWKDQAKCELEITEANAAAVVATSAHQEVVVSGHINYERPAFTMTECRVHGHYGGVFHHALAPEPNKAAR